ncbi:hypothetical protein OO013_15915 [Mangrovivirga sp. M17]|uniref:DUF4293 family protein n=1 Tax=Mangrovivirga halotolerans TaxID=2993936 RepID=A0ABT3RUQ0_9BACT|nr:hypothetical protein [Mangrovivirga halotolerans]MCX2745365.1 hypothetical protein [Mangrovivirga halotolerans]
MIETKPKSIKIAGVIIIVISTLVILLNLIGAAIFMFLSDLKDNSYAHLNSLDNQLSLDSLLIGVAVFMTILGVLFLISGINIFKYKLWANRLATFISVFYIIYIWILMWWASFYLIENPGNVLGTLEFWELFTAVFLTVPAIILIWYLNIKNIKRHFER